MVLHQRVALGVVYESGAGACRTCLADQTVGGVVGPVVGRAVLVARSSVAHRVVTVHESGLCSRNVPADGKDDVAVPVVDREAHSFMTMEVLMSV